MKVVSIIALSAVIFIPLNSYALFGNWMGGPAASSATFLDVSMLPVSSPAQSAAYRGGTVLLQDVAGKMGGYAAVAVGVGTLAYMATAALNAHYGWTNDTQDPWEGLPQPVKDYLGGKGVSHDATGFTQPGAAHNESSNATCQSQYVTTTGSLSGGESMSQYSHNTNEEINEFSAWQTAFSQATGGWYQAQEVTTAYWFCRRLYRTSGSPYMQDTKCSPIAATCGGTVHAVSSPVSAAISTIVAMITSDINSSTAATATAARNATAALEEHMANLLATYGKPAEGATASSGNPLAQATGMNTSGGTATPGDTVYNIWNNYYNNNVTNQNFNDVIAPTPDTQQDNSWIDILVAKFRQLFGIDQQYEPLTNEGINPDENTEVLPQQELDTKKEELKTEQDTFLTLLWNSTAGLRDKILQKINTALPSGGGVCSFCWQSFGSDACINFCNLDYSVIRAAVIGVSVIVACIILIL